MVTFISFMTNETLSLSLSLFKERKKKNCPCIHCMKIHICIHVLAQRSPEMKSYFLNITYSGIATWAARAQSALLWPTGRPYHSLFSVKAKWRSGVRFLHTLPFWFIGVIPFFSDWRRWRSRWKYRLYCGEYMKSKQLPSFFCEEWGSNH